MQPIFYQKLCNLNFLLKWQWKIFYALSIAIFIAGYVFRFWSLDKGFIPTDEGWYMYLYLLTERTEDTLTRSHELFGWIPGVKDIYINRIICTIFNLFAWCFFSYALFRWMKAFLCSTLRLITIMPIIAGLTCLTWLNAGSTASTPSLNYTQLIHIICPTSIGIILLVISGSNRKLLILNGAVTACLFSVQITSLMIVPFILLLILCVLDKPWNAICLWVLGFTLWLGIYVFLVETPQSIIAFIRDGMSATENDTSHNIQALLEVQGRAFLQYIKWVLVAYTILWLPSTLNQIAWLHKNSLIRQMTILFATFFLLLYFRYNLYPVLENDKWYWALSSISWIMVFIILGSCHNNFHQKQWAVIIFLLILPWAIGFGTDMDFIGRHQTRYVTPLLSFIIFLPLNRRFWLTSAVICIILGSLWTLRRPPYGEHFNWMGQRLTDQTIPLNKIGFNTQVKVDSIAADWLMFYRDNVPRGSSCLLHRSNWRTAYLLELKCLGTSFQLSSPLSHKLVNRAHSLVNNGDTLYILSVDSTRNINPAEYIALDSLALQFAREGHKVSQLSHKGGHVLYTIIPKE